MNHLFDSCLIYCSQVAISVNIRADDVVMNTLLRCLLIIVKKKRKENRKLLVHKTEFSFLIGPFFPTGKINLIVRLSLEKLVSHFIQWIDLKFGQKSHGR